MVASTKRKGKRAIGETPELPEDITMDILTRLPVKSLLRFRCVSKPFRALIDSPDFIKSHLNRSLLTKTYHKLILKQGYTIPTGIFSVDPYKLNQALEIHHPFRSNQSNIFIIGSVNGLLCLCNGSRYHYDEKEEIVIWNLATRNYQNIPLSNIEFPDCYPPLVNYGFGYDSGTDSYKLLRLVRFRGKDNYSNNTKAQVYSLRSNSWQRIQNFPYRLGYGKCGQLGCGALHWVVTHNHGSYLTKSVAAFDLATNTYKLVDHPEFQDGYIFAVTKLEGRLSMLCGNFFGRIDVWVMKNYGVKDSWSKLFSVPEVMYELVDLVAYSKSGTEIMLVQDNKKLLWYSLKEGEVRTIRLPGRPDNFEPEICVESLVPLCEKPKDYAKKKGGKDAKGR